MVPPGTPVLTRTLVLWVQLQWTLSHLAEPLTKDEAQEMVKEMDPQMTGQVDYKEYVKVMLMDGPTAV